MNVKELIELLRTAQTPEEVDARRDEIKELIPQVEPMFDYDQKSKLQVNDLWIHSVRTALNLPKDIEDDWIYFAALLHDVAKPRCQVPHKKGKDDDMHYYGHDKLGAEIVKTEIIPMLESKGEVFTEKEKAAILYYVGQHHAQPKLTARRFIRRQMYKATLDQIENLFTMQIADAKAQMNCPENRMWVSTNEFLIRRVKKFCEPGFMAFEWYV